MKKTALLLLALFAFPILSSGSWEQFQKDDAHAAYVCDTGIKAPLCIKWRAKIGSILHGSAPVGGDDGTIYVHDANCLYRFDAGTGDLIFKSYIPSTPANTNLIIYNDLIIVVGRYAMMAFDRINGASKYTVSMGVGSGNCFCTGVYSYYVNDPMPALHDGKIYVGTQDGYIFCVDAGTGNLIKKAKFAGSSILSAPSFDAQGIMYFGSNDNYFYAVDSSTFTVKWKTNIGSPVYGTASIDSNGIYFAAKSGRIYCLNRTTGTAKWTYLTQSWMHSSGSLYNGKYIIGSDDRYVYCINTQTGALIWRSEFLVDNFAKMSCITVCGKVFITGCVDRLVMLNADTGVTEFLCHTTASNFTSPAYIDHKIAFTSNDYYLYVMGECGNCPCSCNATFMPTEGAVRTPVPFTTKTMTPTVTPTFTQTSTPSVTPTVTPTEYCTFTFTATDTPTFTATHTYTPTVTATVTPSVTMTVTPTFTPTSTATVTPTMIITSTYTATPTSTINPCLNATAPKFSVKMIFNPESLDFDVFEITSSGPLDAPPVLTVYPHGSSCNKDSLTFTAVLIPGTTDKYRVMYPKQTGFGDVDRVTVTGTSTCGIDGRYDGGFDKEVISQKDVTVFKNVFNPDQSERARIMYTVKGGTKVKITVYSRTGALVTTLFDGAVTGQGTYEAVWDGKDSSGRTVSSGTYYATVETDYYKVQVKLAVTR